METLFLQGMSGIRAIEQIYSSLLMSGIRQKPIDIVD